VTPSLRAGHRRAKRRRPSDGYGERSSLRPPAIASSGFATNRKEPDRLEASNMGKVPIDRLAEIAPKVKISRARVVDAGRLISAGGIA
jgi:hypothetical protein